MLKTVSTQLALASDTLPEVLAKGNTTGGTDLAVSAGDDITFADNSKAIFGAGSDLSIYSDGSTGQVTGNVNVTGTGTFDRLTTDGVLISMKKDGADVGSVGTAYGVVDIKGGVGGLLMGNAGVLPVDGSGALTSGSYNIGAGSFQFKDLYLSGGAYIGGTAAANLLDDYEEGAWTPTGNGITFSAASGNYTKIGRLVTCTFSVTFPSTASGSNAQVIGLPFTAGSNSAVALTGYTSDTNAAVNGATTLVYFGNATGSAYKTNANLSTQVITGCVNYQI